MGMACVNSHCALTHRHARQVASFADLKELSSGTKLELVTVRFVLLALSVALTTTRRIHMTVAAGLALLLRIGGQRRR